MEYIYPITAWSMIPVTTTLTSGQVAMVAVPYDASPFPASAAPIDASIFLHVGSPSGTDGVRVSLLGTGYLPVQGGALHITTAVTTAQVTPGSTGTVQVLLQNAGDSDLQVSLLRCFVLLRAQADSVSVPDYQPDPATWYSTTVYRGDRSAYPMVIHAQSMLASCVLLAARLPVLTIGSDVAGLIQRWHRLQSILAGRGSPW